MKKDVEQFGIEMFAAVFEHEVVRMADFKRRFVYPGRGQGIEVIGDRSDPAFDGNVFPFQFARITGPS